jgi:hypothetical protein
MTRPISRRAILRGLAAGALLPIVRASRASAGGARAPRKRFVVWFTSCGTSEAHYRPTGGETDFALPAILAPLERHRDRLLVFGPNEPTAGDWSNLRKRRGISIWRPGHEAGGTHGCHAILTGRPVTIENGVPIGPGISIDQHLADTIGRADYLPSLQLGVATGGFPELSYRGPGQPLPVETNPVRAFDRVFAGISDDPAAARRLARRRRVLATAGAQTAAIAPRLAGDDRRRLEAQYEAIRTVAARLDLTATCGAPVLASTDPAYFVDDHWDSYDKVPLVSAAHTDILAAALGCGLTHIATMQYGWAAANTRSPYVGVPEYLHSLSHDRMYLDGPNSHVVPEIDAKFVAAKRWYMEELAAFADKLAAIPESDGSTVLDHTTILVVDELSEGSLHTTENMPFLLLGGAGGYFRTGRYLRYGDRSHNDLLVSCLQAMGLDDDTFGDPERCAGPLPGLR